MDSRPERPRFRWLIGIGLAAPGFGLLAVGLYLAPLSGGRWLSGFGSALLAACAAFLAGILLGFLFGIPRRLQTDREPAPGSNGQPAQGALMVNTNLEQISDWLTKILVGVGLIQIASIGRVGGRLVGVLAASFAPAAGARVVAGSLIVFYSIGGFLTGYLMTRTYITGLFAEFDVAKLKSFVDERVTERLEQEGAAMKLATQQFDDTQPEADVGELRAALIAASPVSRDQVFLLAEGLRRTTWRHPETKARMARTIPVFRLLTTIAPDSHRYWGQLGFALRDRWPADNAGAVEALDRAITTRGEEMSWEWYEFVRAKARVAQLGDTSPDETNRLAIVRDLEVAISNSDIRARIQAALRRAEAELDAEDRDMQRLEPYLRSVPAWVTS